MTDETPDERIDDLIDADGHIDNDPEPKTWRDAMPFFLAAGFVAILVGVLVAIFVISPPGDRLNDSAQVQVVVNKAYTARNSLNYLEYRTAFCEKEVQSPDFPTQQQFEEQNRTANQADGLLKIEDMNVTVDGNTATVTSQVEREGKAGAVTPETLTLTKQGDEWKVCNS